MELEIETAAIKLPSSLCFNRRRDYDARLSKEFPVDSPYIISHASHSGLSHIGPIDAYASLAGKAKCPAKCPGSVAREPTYASNPSINARVRLPRACEPNPFFILTLPIQARRGHPRCSFRIDVGTPEPAVASFAASINRAGEDTTLWAPGPVFQPSGQGTI